MNDIQISQKPTLPCPTCSAPMEYRGESKQTIGSQYRNDLFVCGLCGTQILRPRKKSREP